MGRSVTASDCEGQVVLGSPGMYLYLVILLKGWGGCSGHAQGDAHVLRSKGREGADIVHTLSEGSQFLLTSPGAAGGCRGI